MKKTAIVAVLFSFLAFDTALSGVILLEGKYQNKNLYIQNEFTESGVGFCTYEVRVNGRVTTDEVNSNAFEVDLSQYDLKPGTEVVVEIKYKDGCRPKVLNPQALRPRPTFEIVSMEMSKDGLLKWTTKDENGALQFVIEQFKWNKWIPVGEVQGVGTADNNQYFFQTISHSGENTYRIKQLGYLTQSKYSKPVKYFSTVPQVAFTSSKKSDEILFSSETMYEIYDYYGTIVKRGYGKKLSVSNIPKGEYYLCYDNSSAEFKKK